MSRDLSAGFITEITALHTRIGHLYEVYFDDEIVYATDMFTSVTWNGNLYLALGDFAGYEGLSEQADRHVSTVRLSVSGVTQQWISRVLTKQYRGRRVVVRSAVFNAAWQVVVTPVPKMDGVMDRVALQEDPEKGTSVLVIDALNDPRPFDQTAGRHTNHEEQQQYYPGDGFFKRTALASRKLSWGFAE